MIHVKSHFSEPACLQVLEELTKAGKKKILIQGGDLTKEFYDHLSKQKSATVGYTSSDQTRVKSCEYSQPIETAYEREWDAVFLLEAGDVLNSIERCSGFSVLPDFVLIGKRAANPLIVSLAKSGSHLVTKVLTDLGYEIIGPGGRDPTPKEALPFVRHGARLGLNLRKSIGFDAVNMSTTYYSLFRLFRLIGLRLIGKQIKMQPFQEDLSRISDNTCLCLHTLVLNKIDNPFFQNWARTGEPKIIYNFRDPRAIISSYVRYLMRGYDEIGAFSEQFAHSDILRSMENNEQRIMHAITDTTFPFHSSLRDCTWLLLHPKVLNVRYEDIVGIAGGGQEGRQKVEVAKLMAHLNVEGDPIEIANKAYSSKAETFEKGKINTWRNEFNQSHLDAINARIGDLISLYGYDASIRLKDDAE